MGSITSPSITNVAVSANGSMSAVVGSGTSSMSLSLMAAQPRMLEASMPKPSSKLLSVSSPSITNVAVSANGSMSAVVGSGTSSMSLSLMAAQPRMLEPSMPKPSSKLLSVSSPMG